MPSRPIFTTIELTADDDDDVMSAAPGGRRFSFLGLFTRRPSGAHQSILESAGEPTAAPEARLHFSHKVKGDFKEPTHVALQPPRQSRFATGRQSRTTTAAEPTVLCVSDSGNSRIQTLSLQSAAPLDMIVSRNSRGSARASGEGGVIVVPRGIVCDPRSGGVVYIVDWAGECVQKVRLADGAFLARTKKAKLKYPEAIAILGERLYVTDTGNHRVVVLDAETLQVTAAATGTLRLQSATARGSVAPTPSCSTSPASMRVSHASDARSTRTAGGRELRLSWIARDGGRGATI